METVEQRPAGADLIFLSEFPIGVLSDRAGESDQVVFALKAKPDESGWSGSGRTLVSSPSVTVATIPHSGSQTRQ